MENEHLHGVDFEQVSHLLNIVEATAKHSGKLAHISGAAMTQLISLDEKIKVAATKKRKEEAEAASEAKAKADKEEAEAREAANKPVHELKPEPQPEPIIERRDLKETTDV